MQKLFALLSLYEQTTKDRFDNFENRDRQVYY